MGGEFCNNVIEPKPGWGVCGLKMNKLIGRTGHRLCTFSISIREIKYYFNIWGIRKKKKGAQKKGGEISPISPPLDPRLRRSAELFTKCRVRDVLLAHELFNATGNHSWSRANLPVTGTVIYKAKDLPDFSSLKNLIGRIIPSPCNRKLAIAGLREFAIFLLHRYLTNPLDQSNVLEFFWNYPL